MDDLPEVLGWAQRLGFDGLNVTHPFKQAVIPLLDELSEDAADLGAVNTVVFRDGRRARPQHRLVRLRPGVPRRRCRTRCEDRVVLVGAGGAGRGGRLRPPASRAPSTSRCIDSDRDRADACVVRLAKRFGDDRVAVDDATSSGRSPTPQGLVNATPVGMHGHPGMSVPGTCCRDRTSGSADVVYFPLETELVALARARGCRVLPGGGMAVHQAVGAFEYFTGRAADAARMTAALRGADRPDAHRASPTLSIAGSALRTSSTAIAAAGFDGIEIFDNDLIACPAVARGGRRAGAPTSV